MHHIGAVRLENRAQGLFADDAEHRARAPVRQVMVAAVELDRAKVRDDNRAVVGICLDDRCGDPTMNVQPREQPDDELSEKARHAVKDIHEVRRGVGLRHVLAVHDLVPEVFVDGIKRRFILAAHDGERLGRFVRKLLFDHERRGHAVSLIEVLIRDKAVHLRAERNRLDERGNDDVEHCVGEVGMLRVFLLQICVHIGQIDRLGEIGLVVAAVGIDDWRNKMHAVQIAQQHAILPIAEAALRGFFHILFTHLFLVLTKIASRPL